MTVKCLLALNDENNISNKVKFENGGHSANSDRRLFGSLRVVAKVITITELKPVDVMLLRYNRTDII